MQELVLEGVLLVLAHAVTLCLFALEVCLELVKLDALVEESFVFVGEELTGGCELSLRVFEFLEMRLTLKFLVLEMGLEVSDVVGQSLLFISHGFDVLLNLL